MIDEKKKVGLVDAIISGDVELIEQAKREADPEVLAALMGYTRFAVGELVFIGRWIIGNINNPQEFRFEKEEGARVGRFSAIVTVEHNRGLNTR